MDVDEDADIIEGEKVDEEKMWCPGCGLEVKNGQHYCYQCGSPLTIDAAQEQQERQKKEAGKYEEEIAEHTSTGFKPRLFSLRGAGAGQTYILAGELRLGRDRSNAIVLHDGKISRRHVIFRQDEEGWLISDLNSTNGTYVNGLRIYQPVRLKDGDIIRVGDTQMSFHTTMSSLMSAQDAISNDIAQLGMNVQGAHPQLFAPFYPERAAAAGSGYAEGMAGWLLFGCGAFMAALLVIAIAMGIGLLLGIAIG